MNEDNRRDNQSDSPDHNIYLYIYLFNKSQL